VSASPLTAASPRGAGVVLPQRVRGAARAIVARLGVSGIAAALLLVFLTVVAVFAPDIRPQDPDLVQLGSTFAGPSSAHWLGTDQSGRDVFSRLIVGARPALLGPLLVVVLATVIGSILAIASAWAGGIIDGIVGRTLDLLFAFPAILLAILAVAVLGASLLAAVIAVGIAYIPYVARVVRSEAVRQRTLPYIAACEAQGQSPARICARHLLPNLLPLIIAQATVSFGYAMIDLSALSFLGFGVQAPAADWGEMVAAGEPGILLHAPVESISASFMIVITVLAFTVLGERLGAPAGRRV